MLGLVAEINPEGSHTQRRDEFSKKKKDLERVVRVEEEVVLLLERRVELGVENGGKHDANLSRFFGVDDCMRGYIP